MAVPVDHETGCVYRKGKYSVCSRMGVPSDSCRGLTSVVRSPFCKGSRLCQPEFLQALVSTYDRGEVLFLHRGSPVNLSGVVLSALPHGQPPVPHIQLLCAPACGDPEGTVPAKLRTGMASRVHGGGAGGTQRSAGLGQACVLC